MTSRNLPVPTPIVTFPRTATNTATQLRRLHGRPGAGVLPAVAADPAARITTGAEESACVADARGQLKLSNAQHPKGVTAPTGCCGMRSRCPHHKRAARSAPKRAYTPFPNMAVDDGY